MTQENGSFKPCTSCGNKVHNRQKTCKSCGAISPWTAAEQGIANRGPAPQAAKVAKAEKAPAQTLSGQPIAKVVELNAPQPEIVINGLAPHVVIKDFQQVVGDVLIGLKARKILTDQRLIAALLAAGAPIVPVGSDTNMIVCPCCKHVFIQAKGAGKAVA